MVPGRGAVCGSTRVAESSSNGRTLPPARGGCLRRRTSPRACACCACWDRRLMERLRRCACCAASPAMARAWPCLCMTQESTGRGHGAWQKGGSRRVAEAKATACLTECEEHAQGPHRGTRTGLGPHSDRSRAARRLCRPTPCVGLCPRSKELSARVPAKLGLVREEGGGGGGAGGGGSHTLLQGRE